MIVRAKMPAYRCDRAPGSLQVQPVTLAWFKVQGSEGYWLFGAAESREMSETNPWLCSTACRHVGQQIRFCRFSWPLHIFDIQP